MKDLLGIIHSDFNEKIMIKLTPEADDYLDIINMNDLENIACTCAENYGEFSHISIFDPDLKKSLVINKSSYLN